MQRLRAGLSCEPGNGQGFRRRRIGDPCIMSSSILRAWASGLVATRGLEFGFVPAPDLGPSFDARYPIRHRSAASRRRRSATGADHWTLGFGGTFFEMRYATAWAYKCAYVGQFAETLRSSNQSHVLSAAWAQRQLGPRAFRIHDEARFSAIHARLHWLPLLVEHSLAVVEAREHRIQT